MFILIYFLVFNFTFYFVCNISSEKLILLINFHRDLLKTSYTLFMSHHVIQRGTTHNCETTKMEHAHELMSFRSSSLVSREMRMSLHSYLFSENFFFVLSFYHVNSDLRDFCEILATFATLQLIILNFMVSTNAINQY